MAGGTFTISNGGVFGSLMGTPIINLPQTAILGMHAIKERPIVVDGKVKNKKKKLCLRLGFINPPGLPCFRLRSAL